MPRALAIRHVNFEDLGVLAPELLQRGYTIDYLDAGVDPIDDNVVADADLLIVLGGPIGVGDRDLYPFLDREITAIRGRLQEGRATLGICLGAQLIAHALGAAVTPTGRVEIGYAPIELTDEGNQSVLSALKGTPLLHWHGDEFAIPEKAIRLAGTPGFPNQAFSIGSAVLALQFHLEVDPDRIEHWLIGHAHELATHGLDPNQIRRDARRHGLELAHKSRNALNLWLDAVPPPIGVTPHD